jgi:serine/threonine protein kinase
MTNTHTHIYIGSLDKKLFSGKRLTEEEKLNFVKGIARGMLHLHNHHIVHRDLAARNILLSETGIPKISVRNEMRSQFV